jgi:hypothetical protein
MIDGALPLKGRSITSHTIELLQPFVIDSLPNGNNCKV